MCGGENSHRLAGRVHLNDLSPISCREAGCSRLLFCPRSSLGATRMARTTAARVATRASHGITCPTEHTTPCPPSVSALADKIENSRGTKGTDINPQVHNMLNCGVVESCHGGFVGGLYWWLKSVSAAEMSLSCETSQPRTACSSESKDELLVHAFIRRTSVQQYSEDYS